MKDNEPELEDIIEEGDQLVTYHKDNDLIEYYHYEDMMYRIKNKEEIEDESYH